MREGPDNATLAGACSWRPLVSSWLAGELLAGSIPVIDGTLTVDTTQQIPERLTFTCPAWADGLSWIPFDSQHPLNRFGQQINLQIDITEPVTGRDWQVPIGWYVIQNWTYDDTAGTVQIECVGLLQMAADAAFTAPQVPRSGETLSGVFARLLPPQLSAYFDPALVDRPVPRSFQWDQDRLDALYDIADAWPARIRVDQHGGVAVLPILAEVPDVVQTLRDGHRGTLVGAPITGTRDGVANVVVATATQTDSSSSAPVQAIAEVTGGPMDPDGPYGQVVKFYSSPLVTTLAQCQAAAAAQLRESVRSGLTRVATIAPDPRIEADDAVKLLQSPQGVDARTETRGYVIGYSMPLVIRSGSDAMQVTVGAAMYT